MSDVIILEDNQHVRMHLGKIITEIDKEMKIYGTGYAEEALTYAKENEVSAFIVDIHLLDYSGIEFVRKIRDIDTYMMTPVIFITGETAMELYLYRRFHCYSYLVKPFNYDVAREILTEVIRCGVKTESVEKKKVIFNQRGGRFIFQECEIVYIEVLRRKIEIQTLDGRYLLSGYSLKEIRMMVSESFVQCHRSILVNREYVKVLDKKNNSIILTDELGIISYGKKYRVNFDLF